MTFQSATLRPLKAGEILDRAFQLYRIHFWLFIGISSLTIMPLLGLEMLCLFIFRNTPIFSVIRSGITLLQSFLEINFLYSAMIWAVSRAYLGLPVSWRDSYVEAQYYFRFIFAANFRQGLVYLPAIILWVVSAFVLLQMYSPILFQVKIVNAQVSSIVITAIFVAPYILFFSTRWWFSSPAIIIEDLDSVGGLTRSWFLTSKNFWRVCLILIASGLLSYLLASMPWTVLRYIMGQFDLMLPAIPVASWVFTALGTIISVPLLISIIVILYYDLRVRYEGYDLQFALGIADDDGENSEQDLPD